MLVHSEAAAVGQLPGLSAYPQIVFADEKIMSYFWTYPRTEPKLFCFSFPLPFFFVLFFPLVLFSSLRMHISSHIQKTDGRVH